MAEGLDRLMELGKGALELIFKAGGSDELSPKKEEVINYLRKKGYTDASIAGIVGNIDVESIGSFDYTQKEIDHYDKNNKPVYKKNGGYGLFQFDGSTKKHYNDYLNKSNKKDSMESQIDFMDSYVKGDIRYWNEEDKRMVPALGYGNVETLQDIFTNEKNPGKIAESFNSIFERGLLETKYGNRIDIAMDTFKDL
jgi:hypothetical protein